MKILTKLICAALPCAFAGSAHAQDAADLERHVLATAIFNTACIQTAPNLEASKEAFASNGLELRDNVFVGFGEQILGFLNTGADGKTRTCAVGLADGQAGQLNEMLEVLSTAVWGDGAQQAQNQDGFPVYLSMREGFVATMTVASGNPLMPVLNHIAFAPEGFGQ